MEIAPYTLADTLDQLSAERRRAIRRAAERAGVEILGLHWLLVKPEGFSINHPDAAVRARTAEYLRALIRLCADLGGRVLTHGSPGQRTVLEGWNTEGILAQGARDVRKLFAHRGAVRGHVLHRAAGA